MAYVRKMPYIRGLTTPASNACPLCSLEDSGSHLLVAADTETWSRATLHDTAMLADLSSRQSQREQVATMCSLLTLAHKNMQAMGALDMRLPPWLAQETTTSEMRQGGEERDRTTDSLGITAPEDQIKTRPDIMMVDLATNDPNKIESRMPKKRKANREQATLKDMIGQKKITILEIGYVADTRNEDKYKVKIQQHKALCQILGQEGHEVKLYPNKCQFNTSRSLTTYDQAKLLPGMHVRWGCLYQTQALMTDITLLY